MLDPSGGPFDLMARRVLATNSKLGKALADVVGSCPEGPGEPKAPAPQRQ